MHGQTHIKYYKFGDTVCLVSSTPLWGLRADSHYASWRHRSVQFSRMYTVKNGFWMSHNTFKPILYCIHKHNGDDASKNAHVQLNGDVHTERNVSVTSQFRSATVAKRECLTWRNGSEPVCTCSIPIMWTVLLLSSVCLQPVLPYSGEISPTRCNNCVFYSQWLYSTCFGWQSHPSSGVQ